jgi:hypothetical protein
LIGLPSAKAPGYFHFKTVPMWVLIFDAFCGAGVKDGAEGRIHLPSRCQAATGNRTMKGRRELKGARVSTQGSQDARTQRGQPQPKQRNHRFHVLIENWRLKILNLQL